MFLVKRPAVDGSRAAYNVEVAQAMTVSPRVLQLNSIPIIDGRNDDSVKTEELQKRFSDILEAYNQGAKVYDLAKPVGAWKSKPTRKAAPNKDDE